MLCRVVSLPFVTKVIFINFVVFVCIDLYILVLYLLKKKQRTKKAKMAGAILPAQYFNNLLCLAKKISLASHVSFQKSFIDQACSDKKDCFPFGKGPGGAQPPPPFFLYFQNVL